MSGPGACRPSGAVVSAFPRASLGRSGYIPPMDRRTLLLALAALPLALPALAQGVQALARVLGVSVFVTSPTFVIMRRYAVPAHSRFSSLVHIDAYRIESLAELSVIKLEELLADSRALVCIEWAERIAEAVPKNALHLTFSHTEDCGEETRRRVVYGYENETSEKG